MPAQICITGEFCGKGLAVEHDGSVFSCDHYVYPAYRLGNIKERSLSDMVFSQRQKEFGLAKRDTLPRYSRSCPHLKLCWGECHKNRLVRSSAQEIGLNYLCPGLRRFFAHAEPQLRRIAGRLSNQKG